MLLLVHNILLQTQKRETIADNYMIIPTHQRYVDTTMMTLKCVLKELARTLLLQYQITIAKTTLPNA